MSDEAPTLPEDTFPLVLTVRMRTALIDRTNCPEPLKERFREKANARVGVPLTVDELLEIGKSIYEEYTHTDRATGVLDDLLQRVNEALAELAMRDYERRRAALPLTNKVYRVKVTLRGIAPPIWRRFLILDGTLLDLHFAIQNIMGWGNDHLHEFTINKERYGNPEGNDLGAFFEASEIHDEELWLISQFAPTGHKQAKLLYEYDFGDGWEHDVVIEKVLDPDPAVLYPICLDGARACPPEDCGGPWGYAELAEAMADPKNESRDEYVDWLGGEFDPEAFSIEATNENIQGRRAP